MTWPSPSLPLLTSQTNATVQLDTHPADHATTNLVINDDVAPELTRVGGVADQNVLDIATNAADLAEHEQYAYGASHQIQLRQGVGGAQVINLPSGGPWQIRHGTFTASSNTVWASGEHTGTNLSTWLVPVAPTGTTTLIEPTQLMGYGIMRMRTGEPSLMVTAIWDETEEAALVLAANPAGVTSGFGPFGSGFLLRFNWSFNTNRVDSP